MIAKICSTLMLLVLVLILNISHQNALNLDTRRPNIPRMARQISGTDVICVPVGTCMAAKGSPIHPRIVTESAHSENQLSCPENFEPCKGILEKDVCGQRYVKDVDGTDGPAPYGSHPWQAYIKNETIYTGSGVLIDKFHVLTAAHKVIDYVDEPDKIEIYMGVHNNLTQAQKRVAIDIKVHEAYDPELYINDIAIIRLDKHIDLGYQNNIAKACLPEADTVFEENQRCMVSGWGVSAYGANDAPTANQKQVELPLVNFETCMESMSRPEVLGEEAETYLDVNEMCAGGEANKDACTQDGGAPLMCQVENQYQIAGLVIWGKQCGLPDIYGVYVDVIKYLDWINGKVEELNGK